MNIKVLHINFSTLGGAAEASITLHKEELNQGIESRYLVLDYPKQKTDIPELHIHREAYKSKLQKFYHLILKAKFIRYKTQKRVKGLPTPPEVFTLPYTPFDITIDANYKWADIIHFHWISRFVDFSTFFDKNLKPIVWTLHDKEPFSGGLHCTTNFPFDEYRLLLNKTEKFKEKKLRGQKLFIVSPSLAYEELSKKSNILGKFQHCTINHGIDHSIFFKVNKKECRSKLNLPQNKTILLSVSTDIKRSLKGFSYIYKLSNEANMNNILFCLIGENTPQMSDKENIINLGYINDKNTLRYIYNAADCYISTSLEESFGLSVAEATACGTPVIAFNASGTKDIIDNKNGILIKNGDYEDLKKKVLEFCKGGINFNTNEIIAKSISDFDLQKQTKQYINLYSEILDQCQ